MSVWTVSSQGVAGVAAGAGRAPLAVHAQAHRPAAGADPSRPPLLACGLHYAYGYRRALNGVDLRVERGQVVALFGANGSGKSTLLRILSGLTVPPRGTVRWWGWSPEAAPLADRRRVGVVAHRSLCFDDLTPVENLSYYGDLLGVPDAERRARERLRHEGLAMLADRPMSTLSWGTVQRVAIVRAWLADPQLVLADELHTGLDAAAGLRLRTRLRALREHGGAAVLAGHDLNGALELADRYVVLAGGRVVDTGDTGDWRGRGAEFAERYRRLTAARRPVAIPPAAAVPSSPRGREPQAPPAGGPRWVPAGVAIRAVLRREAVLWPRQPERTVALIAFGLLVALVFGFALDPTAVDLKPVFAGVAWTGVLFAALPALGRSFGDEWENDALLGFRAAGADPAALFYGKCLAHLAAVLTSLAIMVPAFAALLSVRLAGAIGGVALSLGLGTLGFVPAAGLAGAVAARGLGPRGAGLLPLLALPLLAPVVLGTVRAAQAALNGAIVGAAPWLWMLSAYAVLFWALPYGLFPVIAEM